MLLINDSTLPPGKETPSNFFFSERFTSLSSLNPMSARRYHYDIGPIYRSDINFEWTKPCFITYAQQDVYVYL